MGKTDLPLNDPIYAARYYDTLRSLLFQRNSEYSPNPNHPYMPCSSFTIDDRDVFLCCLNFYLLFYIVFLLSFCRLSSRF